MKEAGSGNLISLHGHNKFNSIGPWIEKAIFLAFVTTSHFHPSLIFVSKDEECPIGVTPWRAPL